MRPILLLAVTIAACSSHASIGGSPARDARPLDAPAAKPPDALLAGPDGVARGALPADLPPRVAAFLAEPVPDGVVVRFAEIARGDDPSANTRWDLDRAGRLFFVRHSDSRDAATFDRPLPDRPSLRLDARHVRELFAALDAAGFRDHPGFETVPGAVGGTTVIVRARPQGGKDLHTVVFDVSRPDLLDFLESVTVSL